MNSKAILSVAMAGILVYCVPCTSAKALSTEQDNQPQPSYSEDVQPKAAGLIKNYDCVVSKSNGKLCINGSTVASVSMYTIGFIDITVERSSDKVHWSTEKTLSDMLNNSARNKYINNYTTSVQGGYYYRITCKHYAKESWLGSSQSISNTSNSVWIN